MIVGVAPSPLPQELAERLAESLRAPGAFAVDAETAAPLAPAGAGPLGPDAREALLAFAREQRGGGAVLLDLPLDGGAARATPCACRIMPLEGRRRAVIVVPIDGGVHAAKPPEARPAPPERPPVRILWQSDAEGRITHVGDQLRRMMGDYAGAVAGRRWSDLVGDVMLDPAGEIARALARRETASGVELLWSSDREAGPATLLWSGVPVFDSGRRFRGFRGFLLAPAHLADAPEPASPAVARPEEEAAEARPAAAEPVAEAQAPSEPATPPHGASAALPAMPHLSDAERNAFREIARALGARQAEARRPDLRLVSTTPAAEEPAGEAVETESPSPPSAGPVQAAEPEPVSEAPDSAEPAPDEAAPDEASPAAAESEAEAEEAEAPSEESEPAADDPGADEAEIPEAAEAAAADAETVDADDAEAGASPDAPAESAPDDELAAGVASPESAPAEPQPAETQPGQAADVETLRERVAALAAIVAKAERGEPAAPPSPLEFPLAPAPKPAPPPQADPLGRHAVDLLDRIPVGVLVNRGDRILFANRTLLDLLDFSSVAEVEAHGGVAGLFKGRAPQSDRDGPTGPVLLNSRGGESVAVDARLQGVEWDGGPATLVTFRRSIDVEVSQRLKATELDLRAREAELRETRAVLDTATDGVAVIDEDGRIMTLNRAAEALFGYEQNEVAGESVTILFAPESHAQAADYFEGLKSGGVRSVLNDGRDIIGRVRQGGRIPLFVTLGQISDRPSRKFCAVMRDMTSWKRTERDLIDARKTAEDASAQKSDFLAKMSHEIRTPLNAIIGFAEVMMEERFGPVGNDRYKDYLRDIHASGGHVISLVNDLLDLSKIEAGKLELNFASVNANEIIRGAVSLMQPQSQRARVVVRSALAGRLPSIVADERSLKQIVLNLLSNAVKFTDSGGQVIVSTTLTDLGEVAIRVRDTGIGMTEKELSEAMEPFRQLATARRAGGTGLGLPLTRALVEANRAHLKISSVKNEGTLAEVVFPPTRVLAE